MTIKKLVYLFIAMASAAMISVACSKEKKIGTDDVFGQWKLEDVSAISTKGETYGITVYLEFTSPDRFDIWQQLQEGRYRHYNGTWSLEKSVLSGYYADGKPWGSFYNAKISDGKLQLKTSNGEVTTYVKTTIPEDVKSGTQEGAEVKSLL